MAPSKDPSAAVMTAVTAGNAARTVVRAVKRVGQEELHLGANGPLVVPGVSPAADAPTTGAAARNERNQWPRQSS
jgi:hypothetical protein